MNISRLIKELKNGNNPKENLSIYGQLLMNSYHNIAIGDFSLALTENFDYLCDEKEGIIYDGRVLVEEVASHLCDTAKEYYADDLNRLDLCRNEVIRTLKELEAYLHFFSVYEHVYNRAEFKFDFEPVTEDVEALTLDIMNYIASATDSQKQNERIQSVLGELPLRLTGLKFEEFVENACKCYIGARSDMTDTFFDQMEDASKAPIANRLSDQWMDMKELAEILENTSIDSMSKEELKRLSDRLQLSAQDLAKNLSNGMDLLNIINKLYLLLIVEPYTISNENALKGYRIIRSYLKSIKTGDFFDIDENILGGLEKILEEQQKYVGEHMFMEDSLREFYQKYKESLQSYNCDRLFTDLMKAEKLCYGYPLSDIHCVSDVFSTDVAYISKKTSELLSSYRDAFKQCTRNVRRALMSMAFENMPVPFNSMEQIQDFIYNSFMSTSGYEKTAGVNMIRNLMQTF